MRRQEQGSRRCGDLLSGVVEEAMAVRAAREPSCSSYCRCKGVVVVVRSMARGEVRPDDVEGCGGGSRGGIPG